MKKLKSADREPAAIRSYLEIYRNSEERWYDTSARRQASEKTRAGRWPFHRATISTDVSNGMRIAQQEVFGPLLSVISFDSEGEAVSIANDSPYGLAAGIWTRDLARAHRVAAKVQAGSVWINTYRVTSQLSPFGGFKRSGIGREGGAEAVQSYVQTKSVWVDLNPEFAYPFANV